MKKLTRAEFIARAVADRRKGEAKWSWKRCCGR